MSRKLVLLLFALLAALLLPVGHAVLAQPESAVSGTLIPTAPADTEPNDTPAQATPVVYGDSLQGTVSLSDPFDYYRFTGVAGESVSFSSTVNNLPLGDVPMLLDAGLNPVALVEHSPAAHGSMFWATLPASGTYTISITQDDLETLPRYYRFDFDRLVDVEPNDTAAQASPIGAGEVLTGDMSLSDPVDWYRFSGLAGDTIALIEPSGYGSNAYATAALFNAALNEIPLQPYSNWATLPANGTYYVKLTGRHLVADWAGEYSFHLRVLGGDEPNDTFATAMPVDVLSTVEGTWDYACDFDMVRFQGRAGDVFPVSYPDGPFARNPAYLLYDGQGNLLPRLNVLPADGTYYLLMDGSYSEGADFECLSGNYTVTIGYPMWVSAAQNGLGSNAAIRSADIAMRGNGANAWQLVFDGSDVGITANLNAFERLEDGSILMSLATAQNVPGLGQVLPQDIIRFVPTLLGNNTAGSFAWYLDGSDVGLTTAGEKIDAIVMKPFDDDANPLLISLTGNGSVPRRSGGNLKVADEDLINFVGTSYGANSAGKWRMNLDGSTLPGMAGEDINAATYIPLVPSRNSRLLLGFNSAFKISGIQGGPRDIVQLDGQDAGLLVKGLANKTIDGLAVGVKLP